MTGGSSGIGRATAIKLASEDALSIVVASRNELSAKETVDLITNSGGTANFFKTDVTHQRMSRHWLTIS